MGKERKSNFELLRIVAIVMIILFHYCIHGNGETIFSGPVCTNQIVSVLFGSWGMVGVYLFVFISAYFLLESKSFKIEKVLSIALTTVFYALILLAILSFTKIVSFNLRYIVKSFLSPFTNQYWFIPAYILLFLFYPFLNKFINIVSNTILLRLVVLLSLMIPIYRTIIYSAPIQVFCLFIYLYLLMGYLKRTPNNFIERNAKKIFCCILLLTIGGYITILGIEKFMHIGIYYEIYMRIFRNYFSPITISLALLLFYIFKDIKMPNSKVINNVAKSTLGIYLLHENPSLGKVLWDKMLHINEVYYKPTYILFMLLSCILIFIICYCIDTIRRNTLEKYFVMPCIRSFKWTSKINEWFNEVIMEDPIEGARAVNDENPLDNEKAVGL